MSGKAFVGRKKLSQDQRKTQLGVTQTGREKKEGRGSGAERYEVREERGIGTGGRRRELTRCHSERGERGD